MGLERYTQRYAWKESRSSKCNLNTQYRAT